MNKTSSIFLFLLLNCILGFRATARAQKAEALKNIVYKIAEGDSLRLDIFLPEPMAAPGPSPVVIIIHGGGWVEGDRKFETNDFMRKLIDQLTYNGVAVVSIDYTLLSKSKHFPAPLADCKDAVRWVKAHAAAYKFDPANIGLWGGSAGGHLALLTAYTNDTVPAGAPAMDPISSRVKYVIDFFGPTDLNRLLRTKASKLTVFFAGIFLGKKILSLRKRLIFAITGHAIDTHKQKAIEELRLYSPLQYVTQAVPTFLFHGTKDRVVPLEQSKKLHRLLDAHDITNELIIVNKGDHGFNNISDAREDALVEQTVQYVLQSSK